MSREAYSGSAILLESPGTCTQMHGALQAFRLELWKSISDKEAGKKPVKTVTVDRVRFCPLSTCVNKSLLL